MVAAVRRRAEFLHREGNSGREREARQARPEMSMAGSPGRLVAGDFHSNPRNCRHERRFYWTIEDMLGRFGSQKNREARHRFDQFHRADR
jgi:hypothetical protein